MACRLPLSEGTLCCSHHSHNYHDKTCVSFWAKHSMNTWNWVSSVLSCLPLVIFSHPLPHQCISNSSHRGRGGGLKCHYHCDKCRKHLQPPARPVIIGWRNFNFDFQVKLHHCSFKIRKIVSLFAQSGSKPAPTIGWSIGQALPKWEKKWS